LGWQQLFSFPLRVKLMLCTWCLLFTGSFEVRCQAYIINVWNREPRHPWEARGPGNDRGEVKKPHFLAIYNTSTTTQVQQKERKRNKIEGKCRLLSLNNSYWHINYNIPTVPLFVFIHHHSHCHPCCHPVTTFAYRRTFQEDNVGGVG
jgi:hypothetical protein